jgi:hypothetical protein
MTQVKAVAIAAIWLAISSPSAGADPVTEVLTQDHQPEFCIDPGGGKAIVDKWTLGQLLLQNAGYPRRLLDRANAQGTADEKVSNDEIAYALTQVPPYGPDTAGISQAGLKAIAKNVRHIRLAFANYLERSPDSQAGYLVETPGLDLAQLMIEDYFGPAGTVTIACVVEPAPSGPDDQATIIDQAVEKFRLVGKIENLVRSEIPIAPSTPLAEQVSSTPLEDAEAAKISFRKDDTTETTSLNINMVAGFEFNSLDPILNFVPFIQYQNSETHTKHEPSEHVEALTAGLLLNGFTSVGGVDLDYGVYPTFDLDLEQNAEYAKLDAYVTPGIETGLDFLRFGGYGHPIGGFILRPEVSLVATGGHVFDAGRSTEFDDYDDFGGIGGEASLRVRYIDWEPISHLVLFGHYRYLELFEADLDHAWRLTAGLAYTFPETSNIEIRFGYVDGRNLTTFQRENYWEGSIGLKF